MIEFPVSGVETYWWLPSLVGFFLAGITVSGGVSGAYLLLPFQISILGFSAPAVSGTNMIYNLISNPGGVVRYIQDKKIIWSFSLIMLAGTVPGILMGVWLRNYLLLDASKFKLFAGLVLLALGFRLLVDVLTRKTESLHRKSVKQEITTPETEPPSSGQTDVSAISIIHGFHITINWANKSYNVNLLLIWIVSLVIGILAGAYGIGGGAIISPLLVGLFGLPVYIVAGTTLFTNFVNSIIGVIGYAWIFPMISHAAVKSSPDWQLGISFGIGGLIGGYLSAYWQKIMPEKLIKTVLTAGLIFVSLRYILGFFNS